MRLDITRRIFKTPLESVVINVADVCMRSKKLKTKIKAVGNSIGRKHQTQNENCHNDW